MIDFDEFVTSHVDDLLADDPAAAKKTHRHMAGPQEAYADRPSLRPPASR